VANARRCSRTHCRFTGPFFLGMAGLVGVYIGGFVPLGSQPWLMLAMLIASGNALIWWISERAYGTYSRRGQDRYARNTATEQGLGFISIQSVPRSMGTARFVARRRTLKRSLPRRADEQ